MSRGYFVVALLAAGCRQEAEIDLARYELVDLSHAYSASTLYWPTSPSAFQLSPLHVGLTPAGFFYSAYTFSTPEHGGTHLDAPVHFAEGAIPAERIPLEQLIAPAGGIDGTAQSASAA